MVAEPSGLARSRSWNTSSTELMPRDAQITLLVCSGSIGGTWHTHGIGIQARAGAGAARLQNVECTADLVLGQHEPPADGFWNEVGPAAQELTHLDAAAGACCQRGSSTLPPDRSSDRAAQAH